MTREELEAAMRRQVGYCIALAVKDTHFGGVDLNREVNDAIDILLATADAYAASLLGEIDNYRRKKEPVMHLRNPDTYGIPQCNFKRILSRSEVTDAPGEVTCRSCKATRVYRERAAS